MWSVSPEHLSQVTTSLEEFVSPRSAEQNVGAPTPERLKELPERPVFSSRCLTCSLSLPGCTPALSQDPKTGVENMAREEDRSVLARGFEGVGEERRAGLSQRITKPKRSSGIR